MVLMLIVWGAVRFFAALHWWAFLVEFKSGLSPLYLSITGAGWGVVGCVLLWSMFSGRSWTRTAFLTSAILWLLEYWMERTFFQAARLNLPFALISTILILSTVIVSTLHKSTRDFFTRSEEYEQQNENSGT